LPEGNEKVRDLKRQLFGGPTGKSRAQRPGGLFEGGKGFEVSPRKSQREGPGREDATKKRRLPS